MFANFAIELKERVTPGSIGLIHVNRTIEKKHCKCSRRLLNTTVLTRSLPSLLICDIQSYSSALYRFYDGAT